MSDKSKKLKKHSTNEKIPISEKMRKKDLEKIVGGFGPKLQPFQGKLQSRSRSIKGNTSSILNK